MANESVYYRCFRAMKLPLTWGQWKRLPRNRAYKYEYWDGSAKLSPRPRTANTFLRLRNWRPPEVDPEQRTSRDGVRIRVVGESDWEEIASVFSAAFGTQQPFAGLSGIRADSAARACLRHTREGGDGAVDKNACFVSLLRHHEETRADVCGAILVTMIRKGAINLPRAIDLPGDTVPHLTWVFVNSLERRRGIATLLLGETVRALIRSGHPVLTSTFLVGNDESALWQWRNGFELAPAAYSQPRLRMESAQGTASDGRDNEVGTNHAP